MGEFPQKQVRKESILSEYSRVQSQIVKLQQQAAALRKKEIIQVIANIKKAIKAYGLSAEDLGLEGKSSLPGSQKRRGRPAKRANTHQAKGRAIKVRKNRARKPNGIDRRSVVAPKFRDPSTGATWTGRGKQPKWLAAAIQGGKKLDNFRI